MLRMISNAFKFILYGIVASVLISAFSIGYIIHEDSKTPDRQCIEFAPHAPGAHDANCLKFKDEV